VGERTFMRVGAGALVVGMVLALVFNLIHPRSSDALDSTRAELELVADSDIWLFDHMMLGVAAAFALLGLVALATSMRGGDAEPWARAALIAGVAGIVVIWITVVVDGMASKEVADAWAQSPDDPALLAAGDAVVQISLAMFTAVIGASFGVTPIAFGLAILASGVYARGLGWAAIASGVLGFVTAMIQFLGGPSNLTAAVLFPIASLSFTLIGFVLGVQLWRRSEAPATTAAPAPPTPTPAGGA
jgi:hypothetical protein